MAEFDISEDSGYSGSRNMARHNASYNAAIRGSMGSIGSGSSGQNTAEEPEFLVDVTQWKCPLCSRVLRTPVQTPCGHRFCDICMRDYIRRHGDPVKCPIAEEDCENVSEQPGVLFKDMSAQRDILKLPVRCKYSKYGCKTEMTLKNYENHTRVCEHKRVPCLYKDNGCHEMLKLDKQFAAHVKICDYRPKPCPLCDQIGSHAETCDRREKPCTYQQYGCGFEGTVSELEHHHKMFMPQHLEMVTVHLAQLSLENTRLKNEQQAIKNEKDILARKLNELEEENKRMNLKLKNFERQLVRSNERQTEVETNVERLTSNLNTHREEHGANDSQQSSSSASMASIANLTDSIRQMESQSTAFNMRLQELDVKHQLLEATTHNGILLWKIENYARRKADAKAGRTLSLYSHPFYTSQQGYKMCARVYLNGDGVGRGTYISLFFTLMRGDYDALLPWPFRQRVTFQILDQENRTNHIEDSFRPDPNSNSFRRPEAEMNISSGCPRMALQVDVEGAEGSGSRFLKEDTLFIKVIVDTANIPPP